MSETKSMIENIISGQLTESKDLFNSLMLKKVDEMTEITKVSIGQDIFSALLEDSSDDEEQEQKAFNSKHALGQLKALSVPENTPDEEQELTASGQVDKRSKKPTAVKSNEYIHLNGEKTSISPADAAKLHDALLNIKPEVRNIALKAIHGSKAGFEKVHSILGNRTVANKSVYSPDKDSRVATV